MVQNHAPGEKVVLIGAINVSLQSTVLVVLTISRMLSWYIVVVKALPMSIRAGVTQTFATHKSVAPIATAWVHLVKPEAAHPGQSRFSSPTGTVSQVNSGAPVDHRQFQA